MANEPLQISTPGRLKPACPRCASPMILLGRLTDVMGNAVQFAVEEDGFYRPMGGVRSCYCNDCGEVTLTLE